MDTQSDLISFDISVTQENAESFRSVGGDFFQKAKIYDVEDGRESLMLLKNMEDSFDVGRESLGIIQLNLTEERLSDVSWLNVPNINLELASPRFSNSGGKSSLLNNGFLYPSRASGSFSVSSYNSIKSSISSVRVDNVSMLSSIENSDLNVNSELNKGFLDSYSSNRVYNSEMSSFRSRLTSLPVIVENQPENSRIQITKSESVIRRSLNLSRFDVEDEEEIEADTQFNDSVFIEAQIIASKIADGSILEDNGHIGLLDSTPQPDLINDSDEEDSDKNVKLTTEDIFKRLDKILPMRNYPNSDKPNEEPENKSSEPPQLTQNNLSTNTQSSSHSNTAISPTVHKLECFQNLSNIFHNKSLSKSFSTSKLSNGSGRSKSRDAKELLDNLSDILNSENPTSQQKAEGQSLIYSLADILYNSSKSSSSKTRESLDDSGHSSIEIEHDAENQNEAKFVDIMDLRTKPLCDTPKPLDLSVRTTEKKLNRSLSCPNASQAPAKFSADDQNKVEKEKRGESSNIFTRISKSQASLPNVNSFGKLKSKKVDDTKKKGPLRAILPIGKMARVLTKSKTMGTPPKAQSSSTYKSKTTSTPKRESNICPVAQSTPDENPNNGRKLQLSPSQLPKPRFSCPVSPLARPALREPRNVPASEVNSQNASLNRRKSASDIKAVQNSMGLKRSNSISKDSNVSSASDIKAVQNSMGLKRSNSISKDSNVSSAVNRVRDSILRHAKDSGVDKKNTLNDVPHRASAMDRLKSTVKPFNLMSKLRRSAGKENVDH